MRIRNHAFLLLVLIVLLASCTGLEGIASSWTPPVNLTASADTATQRPRIAVRGGSLQLVYMEGMLDAATGPAYIVPGGVREWVGPHSQPGYVNPAVAVDSAGTLHVVWAGVTRAPYSIYYASKPLDGAWSAPTRLSSSTTNCVYPDVAVDSTGRLWVVWQDSIADTNSELFYATKLPGGGWSSPARITYNSVQDLNVRIVIDALGKPVIVWRQSGVTFSIMDVLAESPDQPLAGSWDILESHYRDGAWSYPYNVSASATASHFPAIASDASGVYVAWEEERPGGLDQFDIVVRRKEGGAWLSASVASHGTKALYPAIAVAGCNVAVVWADYRTGKSAAFYSLSSNCGANFQGDEDVSRSTGTAYYPDVKIAGTTVYAVWQDSAGGNLDVWTANSPIGIAPTPIPTVIQTPGATMPPCPTPIVWPTCPAGCVTNP